MKTKNEYPILFTGKMVNAILENKKSVTRRLLIPQPPEYIDFFEYRQNSKEFRSYMIPGEPCSYPPINTKYWPGLKLWVREAWKLIGYSNESGYEISVQYRADNSEKYNIELDNEDIFNRLALRYEKNLKSIPSIFIPRAVSRIDLEIIDVKIERLHELDDCDAALEGCVDREDYIKVWNNINLEFPWEANPWVYRIHFKKL